MKLSYEGIRLAQRTRFELDNLKWRNNNKLKWNDVYNTEQELIDVLKNLPLIYEKDYPTITPPYKGYVYITSFSKQLQAGKTLTNKQITVCKRLAPEIFIASKIKDYWI